MKDRLKISQDRDRFFPALMLFLCLGFYLFFAWYDGGVICVDTESYVSMDISREPLYCMLLAAFRRVYALLGAAGEQAYLDGVAYFQSLLSAIAAWSLVRYIQKECAVPKSVTLLLLMMPIAVSVLCRFVATRGSMYSNSILTEGIAIPLYLLFFRYLLEYVLKRNRKAFLIAALLSFLLISTRKQMVISLLLLCLSMLWLAVCDRTGTNRKRVSSADGKHPEEVPADPGEGKAVCAAGAASPDTAGHHVLLRALAGAVLCAACVLGASILLDLGYNYVVRGEAVRHTNDSRFLTTMAFYTAEREDALYIGDEQIRELFLEIYDSCDEQGYLMHSAGEGWLNRVTHFGDVYDGIQIDTMWPAVNTFVQETYDMQGLNMSLSADDVMNVINRAVMPHNIGKLLVCFVDNIRSGLVTTVAQRNRVLNWYTLAIYALYLVLLLKLILRRRGLPVGTREENGADAERAVVTTAVLTLLSIALNVGLVSMVIFCQTRYTIYNMALFYISLLLLMSTLPGRHLSKHSG